MSRNKRASTVSSTRLTKHKAPLFTCRSSHFCSNRLAYASVSKTYGRLDAASSGLLPVLTAVATDSGGRTGTTTRVVSLQKAPPPVITAYLAEVSSITPAISYAQTPITISGRAKDRVTNAAVGNASLKVILTVNGFKRQLRIPPQAGPRFRRMAVQQSA